METRYVYTLESIGNTIFAGCSIGGVYTSSNNGANWVNTSLNNRVIQKLFASGNNIFAGTSVYGVYLSTNNGASWSQTALNNKTIYALTSSGSNIYAGGDSTGVNYSTNNGASWTQTGLPGMSIYSLGTGGGLILAGTSNFGVYASTSGGNSWIPTNLNNTAVFSITFNGNVVFAGTSNSIYKSTNFGNSWVQSGLIDELVGEIVISGNSIIAGTFSGGVYVSNDNGMNWEQKNEGLTQLTASGICIANNFIFAGTQNSVFRRPVGELIGIQVISNEVPEGFSLSQNYPNPFNPVTNIEFSIPKSSYVKLVIYDITGREVETLVKQNLTAGTYKVDWDASKYPSGIYFYKINANGFTAVKKMILVK
jgi:hypothetical protein